MTERNPNRTKFERAENRASLFGKRPMLQKDGREAANVAATKIRNDDPDFVDDPEDIRLSDVLKYLNRHGQRTGEQTTTLLTDLLMDGLTIREATVWYLHQEGGLTLNEIDLTLKGKQRNYRKDDKQRRQDIRNLKGVLQSAANKLGVQTDF